MTQSDADRLREAIKQVDIVADGNQGDDDVFYACVDAKESLEDAVEAVGA